MTLTEKQEKQYYGISEAARLLGVNRQRIYQLINEGRLAYTPASQVNGGAATAVQYLISAKELARFAAIDRPNGVQLGVLEKRRAAQPS